MQDPRRRRSRGTRRRHKGDQRERLIRATVDAFGRLDVLVNSAFDPGEFTPFEESSIDDGVARSK